jgi:hypothetical protein
VAQDQAREEVHRLVYAAVVGRRPLVGIYDSCRRWLCPHKLGWNRGGQLRVLCYQYGGESISGLQSQNSAANWRCLALEKLSAVELLDEAWHSAPNHSQPQTCIERVEVDAEDYPPREPQNGQ